MILLLLLGAAAALWGASTLSWAPDAAAEPGVGSDPSARPSFTTLALLSLAGVAGVFAVSGWTRVLLGAILAATGAVVGWQAIATRVDGGFDLLTGRGLALLGGVALLAAGALVAAYARRLPTMGSKYELAAGERRSGDPDRDLWDGLSDGRDPTVDGR